MSAIVPLRSVVTVPNAMKAAVLYCGLLLGLSVQMRAQASTYFVAPTGSDANPGTLNRPFATLQRAQRAARQSAGRQPVTVLLRGGTYYLTDTLTLTAEDSGSKSCPVVYKAYQQEIPVISGGARLDLKWEPYRDGILKAAVPSTFRTDQLFVNGELQHIARYPNFDPAAQYFDGFGADAFSKERAARWANPAGGFIHAMHSAMWGDYHYLITGKDAQGEVTYVGGWQNNRQMGMHREYRFVENIFEELDASGEWFHDSKSGTLYYYPPAGLDLSKAVVEGVRLRHLVELRGDQERPVRFITFQGITFRHAARTFMDNREPLLRSDWTTYRGGAVCFNGSEDCTLRNCFLDQLGGNSVFVNNYNRRVTVRGCRIANGGANGVAFVGDPGAARSPLFEYNQVQDLPVIDRTPGPRTSNYPAECLVEDCLIYRTGRVEKQTAAVQIEMSQGITVRHCSIYDVPRAGINIGSGAWGGHVIEYCDVFDTVKETGDHGSFNSWGRDRFWRPNTRETDAWVRDWPEMPFLDVVKPIVLHDNRWRCDHGWDIDLDDGSSNYLIYNNLCLNGGIKNREGYKRTVQNNIMVGNGFHPHVWYANSGDVFQHNIVMRDYAPARMPAPPWGTEIDDNLFHRDGQTIVAPAAPLQKRSGRDGHSLITDARFMNAVRGDYRVKTGSPALALGFKNFPMDRFGVTSPSLRAMARTPELPGVTTFPMDQFGAKTPSRPADSRDSSRHAWLGAQVRNIVGQGEMSAFGTPGETGVLVLDAGANLSASGLRNDDVLLAIDGHKIDSVSDLLRYSAALKDGQVIELQILRAQRRSTLTLRIRSQIAL